MSQVDAARMMAAALHSTADRRGDPADMRGRRFQGDGKERHRREGDQIGLHAGAVDRPEAEPGAGRTEQQPGQDGVEPEVDAAKGIAGANPG